MLKYEGPIVPDLPFRRRLVPKELAIRCTRVWKALAYITQRVQDLGFLGRRHYLHYWGDDSFYLSDLWLQLSKRYSGQPAWLRASPKSTINVASPGGDCDVLGACPGALRWAEVSRVVLSRGSQCCCGLQKCFPIDADWGITPFTSPLHLTSISNYSFSYNSFSFISKSDVDFLGMYFHWASRDVDQTLNYSFHS